MDKLQYVVLCVLVYLMHPGKVYPQNVSRNFIFSMNDYDSIITVVVNDTTEQIMEFNEATEDLRMYPTRVHVRTNDTITGEYPLFITAQQQKGISSWELPLVIRTSSARLHFKDMARTLCPQDAGNATTMPNRPTVHITTSSPKNVSLSIKLRRVADFNIALGNESTVRVAPSTPHYYHFSFRENMNQTKISLQRFNYTIPNSVLLIIESDDDICAVVSIQNYSCPVFDNEKDVLYQGYDLTMTRKGGITLTDRMYPEGFFIVFIVKENDEVCTGVSEKATEGALLHEEQVEVGRSNGRVKNLRFRIIATISYREYVRGALVTLAVVTLIAMFALCVYIPTCDRIEQLVPTESEIPDPGPSIVTNEDVLLTKNSARRESLSDSEPELDAVPRMTVQYLSRARPTAHSRRSNRYFWSALTVAVVYALPVVQLLSTYQHMVFQTGNQDLCYYNFFCAHPLGVLSDFNHVYSNIGYVILGLVFMMQTRLRQSQWGDQELGIPQHNGLFYSMGLALVMEGILSACYHLCPNKMNFQFDSSFMYVISVLCMVKLYQNRHPDVNASAHSTFMLLAAVMAIGLLGIMYPSVGFWALFTVAHLSICLVLTMQIYYVGRFKFDRRIVSRAFNQLSSYRLRTFVPYYTARAVLLGVANSINLALAIYGLVNHNKDFARHLLGILMGNTILYLLSYVVMKMVYREKIYVYTWLYFVLAHVAWFGAYALFVDSRTKWSQTPANSRRHNAECSALEFYDTHDLWHIASAAALYLSFNVVLTIDDGLKGVSRHDIPVF